MYKNKGTIRTKRIAKRNISALMLTAIALFSFGCNKMGNQGNNVYVDVYTPVPTQVYVPVPTVAPSPTGIVTPSPDTNTEAPQPSETPVPNKPDYTVFDDAAFLGNSTFEGLYRFGVITHGKFFTKVGLNVLTVHTATTDKGNVPIIDELRTGAYAKVLLMFGENELGWPSPSSFVQKYSELLDAVWLRQPNARIYIVAMPPVSEKVSSSSTTGITNANIQNFNAMLKDLAERRGCDYVDVPKELMTLDGVLPSEASSDGIHLNLQYSRYWADHICLTVMGVYEG